MRTPGRREGTAGLALLVTTVLAVAAVVFAYHCHGDPPVGIDDANIYLVYAEHLAGGHGLVYNVGGERVEGGTDFLYTVLAGGAVALTRGLAMEHGAELALLLLSVVLLVAVNTAVVVLIERLVRRGAATERKGLSPYAWLYLACVLGQPGYVIWTTITLLDAGLWSALVTGALLVTLWPGAPDRAKARRLSTFALLATLARPEGMLLVPALIVLHALHVGRPGTRLRAIRAPLVTFVVTLGALTAFRLAYFGYPLPNTYYAKVAPSVAYNLAQGGEYLLLFVLHSPIVLVACLCAVLAALRFGVRSVRPGGRARLPLSDVELVAATALVVLLVPVATGGDHFRMFRFLQPIQPALGLLLVLAVERSGLGARLARLGARLPSGLRPLRVPLGLAGALGLVAIAAWDATWLTLADDQPLSNEFRLAESGLSRGTRLQAFFEERPELPSLGVVAAGAIKRGYGGEVVDLMGLNDTRMGHSESDRVGIKNHAAFHARTFFELAPQLLEVSFDVPDGGPVPKPVIRRFNQEALKGLLDDAEFHERYVYAYVTRDGHRRRLGAFFERAYLDELRVAGGFDVVELRMGRGRKG